LLPLGHSTTEPSSFLLAARYKPGVNLSTSLIVFKQSGLGALQIPIADKFT
jgi:hypothetical protein